jgi:hypothetical protein
MVRLSATSCSCIAILWVSLVSFVVITLCVASQRAFVVDFVIDSVRKLLDIPSYYLRRATFRGLDPVLTSGEWSPHTERLIFCKTSGDKGIEPRTIFLDPTIKHSLILFRFFCHKSHRFWYCDKWICCFFHALVSLPCDNNNNNNR